MSELIIIKTENSKKVRDFLNKEQINYEVFYNQEEKFSQEYRKAWQNPQRLAEAKQLEQAAMTDWTERMREEK